MKNGFIVIDKVKGITSARVVGKVKHILYLLGEKETKIGHLGTLDPDGEGVLPIALGRATRLFAYQEGKQKTYLTRFQFGISTDTLDTSGKILETSEILPTLFDVKNIAKKMLGKSLQVPPQYSAKCVDGVRGYKVARRGGFIDLPSAEIEIFDLKDIFEVEKGLFQMTISVSAGTYIRAIARDMGVMLGTVCAMEYIKRIQNGVFLLDSAVKTEELTVDNFDKHLLPLECFLKDFPRVDVPIELGRILLTGSELYGLEELPEIPFLVYLENKLIGIGLKTVENKLRIKTWLL